MFCTNVPFYAGLISDLRSQTSDLWLSTSDPWPSALCLPR